MEQRPDSDDIAGKVVEYSRAGRQTPPFSDLQAISSVDDAYRIAATVRDLNRQAGMTPVGRKIGFTNRTVWAHYAPMWGYVYDSTVHFASEVNASLSLGKLAEPRIEPEIVVKLNRTPELGMSEQELFNCLEWAACGFEVVQSIYPGWRFADVDAIAAGGLHGALIVGRPTPLTDDIFDRLQRFTCDLSLNGELLHQGGSESVMGGPLVSLQNLVNALAANDELEALKAEEIVTTGSLTAVPDIEAGQAWSMSVSDLPCAPLTLELTP